MRNISSSKTESTNPLIICLNSAAAEYSLAVEKDNFESNKCNKKSAKSAMESWERCELACQTEGQKPPDSDTINVSGCGSQMDVGKLCSNEVEPADTCVETLSVREDRNPNKPKWTADMSEDADSWSFRNLSFSKRDKESAVVFREPTRLVLSSCEKR